MKNYRIAFCFYGQTRVSDVINLWFKQVENEYDFFISTWDDGDSRKLDLNFTDKQLLNFSETENKLQNLHLGDSSPTYQTYLINQVITLKEKYETLHNFKYDLVIISRTDYVFDLDHLRTELNKLLTLKEFNKPIFSMQTKLEIYERSLVMSDPILFIANNSASKLFSQLFNDLFVSRMDLELNFNFVAGAHHVIGFFCAYYNSIVLVNNILGWLIRPHILHSTFKKNYKLSYSELNKILGTEEERWILENKWKK